MAKSFFFFLHSHEKTGKKMTGAEMIYHNSVYSLRSYFFVFSYFRSWENRNWVNYSRNNVDCYTTPSSRLNFFFFWLRLSRLLHTCVICIVNWLTWSELVLPVVVIERDKEWKPQSLINWNGKLIYIQRTRDEMIYHNFSTTTKKLSFFFLSFSRLPRRTPVEYNIFSFLPSSIDIPLADGGNGAIFQKTQV